MQVIDKLVKGQRVEIDLYGSKKQTLKIDYYL